jgi:hypothetical protein
VSRGTDSTDNACEAGKPAHLKEFPMKKFILCVALVGCALGCKSDKNAAVSDPSSANMPKAESSSKSGCCHDGAACTGEKSDCEKSCPAMKDKPQG